MWKQKLFMTQKKKKHEMNATTNWEVDNSKDEENPQTNVRVQNKNRNRIFDKDIEISESRHKWSEQDGEKRSQNIIIYRYRKCYRVAFFLFSISNIVSGRI